MKRYLFFILLAFLSLLPNINFYSLSFEETTRAIVAFEMSHGGNYFQPTILGENYYNKPPLFNWLIIFSSQVSGWDTITARAVSLFFTLANTLLVSLFAYRLFKNWEISLLSGLIFITFGDVLYWYGWLAEIDITLTFFVFLLFVTIFEYYKTEKKIYAVLSGFISGLIFMLKGFPAFAFYGLSLTALVFFKKSPFIILRKEFLVSHIVFLITSFWWVPLSENPEAYIRRLWEESFSRVESSTDLSKFLQHLVSYPLLHIKQLLPSSIFLIFLFIYRKLRLEIPSQLKFPLALIGFNYIPYILSATSQGRYVLPLAPIVAILMGYLFHKFLQSPWKKALLVSFAVVIFFRALFGFTYLPFLEERRGYPKLTAFEVAKIIGKSEAACNCDKNFCVFVDFFLKRPLKKERFTPEWVYLIDCKPKDGAKVVKKMIVDKKTIYLMRRK
ncbi:ArnT family glycosyltransferase [Aquifex sp.]